jgi:uncharacterized membrane protein
MNQSIRNRTPPRSLLRWVITLTWIVLGIALSLMCIKVFGDTIAEIGVPALVVIGVLIWYFTGRRDRRKPEEHV